MSTKFDPDWVVPTSEMLREWLDSNHLSTSVASVITSSGRRTPSHIAAMKLLDRVLADALVGPKEARVLATVTGISAQFWLAFEHNYRTWLAAGRTVVGGAP